MPWKGCSVKPSLTRIAFSDFISYSFIKPNGRRLTRTTGGAKGNTILLCSQVCFTTYELVGTSVRRRKD